MPSPHRKRRKRGSQFYARLDPRKWARARQAAFERDGHRCTKCGSAGALEAHHVKRLEDGGSEYDLDNILTRCRDCHVREHNPRDPETDKWREYLASVVN